MPVIMNAGAFSDTAKIGAKTNGSLCHKGARNSLCNLVIKRAAKQWMRVGHDRQAGDAAVFCRMIQGHFKLACGAGDAEALG